MLKRLKKRVFIHHDGALGDTLLSMPCISRIRESASHIHLAGRGDVSALLMEGTIVNAISSVDSALYSSLYTDRMDEELSQFLASHDALYLFTVHHDSAPARHMRQIRQDLTVIKTIPPEGSRQHAASYRLRQCGCRRDHRRHAVSFRVPGETVLWAKGFLKGQGYTEGRNKLIAVHPGSGGIRKCWPWESFQELFATAAADHRIFCIIFSGPAEDDSRAVELSGLARKSGNILHLRNEPLVRVAALLDLSDYYVGNDSGISQLAGLLQCRGTVLFGPTDSRLWRPYGNTLSVLRFDGADAHGFLSADRLWRRILEGLCGIPAIA